MKKLLLVSILAACGGSDKKPAPAPVVANSAPPPAPAPIAVAAPAPKPAPVAPLPPNTPAECIAYLEVISSLLACPKLEEAVRDALKQGAEAMRDGLANSGPMPAEALDAMRDGCKAGVDAIQQSRSALGC